MYVVSTTFLSLAGQCRGVFCLPRVGLTQIGRNIALPTTEMFCRPFAELFELMYQALGFFHGR